ncbi:MAG: ABC transporter ATP-binding protein [Clostridia bacterium]|nr:ABC transporter ATP-binding protein [Clostridia bacterium]
MKKRNRHQDMAAIKWMYRVSKKHLKGVTFYGVLSVVLAFAGVWSAFGTKSIVNGATYRDADLLAEGAVILAVILTVQFIFKIISRNIFERSKAKIEMSLRGHIFETVLKKDYSELTDFHSGEIMNRLTSDVNVVTDGIMGLLPRLITLLVRLVVAVLIMLSFDPVFTIVFVAGGGILVGFSRLFKKYLKNIHKKSQESDGKVRSFMQESVSEVLVVKVFNAYDRICQKAYELMNENYRVRIKRATVSIFANSGVNLVFSAGHLFAIIWGGYRVYNGFIDIGELSAVLQLVNQIQGPLASLSGILPSFYATVASVERLMEFENLTDEPYSGEKIDNINEFYKNLRSIKVRDVTFKYNRDFVFKDTNCEIRKGDFVAVTGISGIGKSTLFKLMMGVLSPQSGEILLCGNGERKADKETRRLFSYVPQGNLLLSGTVHENITFMNSEKTKEDIDKAIRISCCDEFINEFEQGLDTILGERGLGLSEGQAQRIAIARAILYDAPIILLDEATSALDEATEKRLIQNLRELNDKTLLIITHKKAALSVCNKELKIINGKIIIEETGDSDEN